MPLKKRPRSGSGKKFQALVRKNSVNRGGAKVKKSSAGPYKR